MRAADRATGPPPEVVHLVAPASLDDPQQPSGGNVYDRELADALRTSGQPVVEHLVDGTWPGEPGEPGDPGEPGRSGGQRPLDALLDAVPTGATVLVDGMLGLVAPGALQRQRGRLRVWLIVHLPLALFPGQPPTARARERRALEAVTGVIATSGWTRQWLVSAYDLEPGRVRVARPGVSPAVGPTCPDDGSLLCVGAIVPGKGQDVLVRALDAVRDRAWSCRLVGPLDRDAGFVGRVRRQVDEAGLADRITFTGALPRPAVAAAFARAGLLVLPSRLETYGMVVTEALAHGVPVLASDTGGVEEAVGSAPDGRLPGVLVEPDDAAALGAELRRWLEDATWRRHLRAAARARRGSLPGWARTASLVRSAIGEAS